MADLASVALKMNDLEIASDAPVSESLASKFGANTNYAIDQFPRITALENRVEGKQISGSWPYSSGTYVDALVFTVTLAANDFVKLTVSNDVSSFGVSSIAVGSGGVRLLRNSSVIGSIAGGANVLPMSTWTDKPGAGTWTYQLQSFLVSVTANACFTKVKG